MARTSNILMRWW